MKTQSADVFNELQPFYRLCYLGLFINTILLSIFGFWAILSTSVLVAFLFVICILGLHIYYHKRTKNQLQIQLKNVTKLQTSERPRLKAKLDVLRTKLHLLAMDDSAQLVMIPSPAIILSTLRSDSNPIVEMSAGFWSTYSNSPDIVEAALAHEAGHIAARDIEKFKRLTNFIQINLIAILCLAVFLLIRQSESGARIFLYIATPGVVVALAWSALLNAREIQADAYAAHILGSDKSIRELLLKQLERRKTQSRGRSPWRKLITWLIQPDLRWRSTLPALQGRLSARIEFKLGFSIAGFLGVLIFTFWGGSFFTKSSFAIGRNNIIMYIMMCILTVYLDWITYNFIWNRNRFIRDPTLLGIVHSLGSYLRFTILSYMLVLLTTRTKPVLDWYSFSTGKWEKIEYSYFFLIPSFMFWAMPKLALLSEKEWYRNRPSLIRAIMAFFAISFPSAIILLFFSLIFDFSPERKYYFIIENFVALFFGITAHYSTSERVRQYQNESTPTVRWLIYLDKLLLRIINGLKTAMKWVFLGVMGLCMVLFFLFTPYIVENTVEKIFDLPSNLFKWWDKSYDLRYTPNTNFSEYDVEDMIKKHNFYCKYTANSENVDWSNPQGEGIDNKFELQEHGSIVFDRITGLYWMRFGLVGTIESIDRDLQWKNEQELYHYNDWRLPTLEEVMSLMEEKPNKDSLYIDPVFSLKPSPLIWTADKKSESETWAVNFQRGYCRYYSSKGYAVFALLVRSDK